MKGIAREKAADESPGDKRVDSKQNQAINTRVGGKFLTFPMETGELKGMNAQKNSNNNERQFHPLLFAEMGGRKEQNEAEGETE